MAKERSTELAAQANLAREVVPAPKNKAALSIRVAKGDSEAPAVAKALLDPTGMAASTIQRFSGDALDTDATRDELQLHVAAVHRNDLKPVEAMLICQAKTLDDLFHHLARRAQANGVDVLDTYLRLAFKAQAQSRATLETLATIKNPPVVYAKQANFAAGAQQVNNGVSGTTLAHPLQIADGANELLGAKNGKWLDAGTQGAASAVNSRVATVVPIKRPKNQRREKAGIAQQH